MDAHEILCAARNLIARDGWWCGDAKSAGGQCVATALSRAGGVPSKNPAYEVMAETVGVSRPILVINWNDAPERTKEEVLEAFDEAIRRTAPEPLDPFASAPLDYSPEAVAMP